MASLEHRIFKRDFLYRQRFINVCILRIKYGHRSERTVRGYKMYVFKMMHDIVKKNICNFINLIMYGTNNSEIPTHDDVLTSVYIMFDKCLYKYKVRRKNKFYYYFNKALSRYFYREYCKILKRSNIELTNAMEVVHPRLRLESDHYNVDVLMDNLNFNELERKIVVSRMKGQKIVDFLAENEGITNNQYTAALKHMKLLINDAKMNNKW